MVIGADSVGGATEVGFVDTLVDKLSLRRSRALSRALLVDAVEAVLRCLRRVEGFSSLEAG